jgi:ribosomal protein S18 acetylase RimI-like enzyme
MGSLGAPDFRFRDEVRRSDIDAVAQMVAATGFFTPGEMAIAIELVEERLQKGEASGYLFLFAEQTSGLVVGYTCYGPVPATQSTYDLYWIAVRPECQRSGLGRELLARTEGAVVGLGGADLYIETSSRALYGPTQSFYSRAGYRLAAEFPDFYAAGDGKLVYVKRLRSMG